MDLLADVLRVVRLTGAIFFSARLSSRWAFRSPPPGQLARHLGVRPGCVGLFHVLVDGRARILTECSGTLTLEPGTMIILPHGDAHVMTSDDDDAQHEPLGMTTLFAADSPGEVPRVSWGTGGRTARFICGYLHCDQSFNPLIGALPRLLLVRRCGTVVAENHAGGQAPSQDGTARDEWLEQTLRFAAEQAVSDRPGTAAVLARLFELLYVEVLRRYASSLPEGDVGWLAALRDRDVGRALRLLHTYPERQWDVARLGREIGMSRSALATRFTRIVGAPPMRYLGSWRVQLAKRLLEDRTLSIAQVAARVGYGSEAAFHRAFKRQVGVPPGEWRQSAGARESISRGPPPDRA
jgi:AraC-like DNA-binding protein